MKITIEELQSDLKELLVKNGQLKRALENVQWMLHGEQTGEALNNLRSYVDRVLTLE